MRKPFWLLLVTLLIAGLVLSGCGGGNNEAQPAPQEESSQEEPAAAEKEKEVAASDMVARGKAIPGASFECVMQDPAGDGTIITKTWIKEQNIRTEMDNPEMGGNIVFIVKGGEGVAYMYQPEENMAMHIDLNQAGQNAQNPVDEMDPVDMKYLGRETMDGKECLVYEVGGGETKVWLWEEHGFPVRTETTVDGQTMVMEYRNIEIGDISADLFELPEGVEVMQL